MVTRNEEEKCGLAAATEATPPAEPKVRIKRRSISY